MTEPRKPKGGKRTYLIVGGGAVAAFLVYHTIKTKRDAAAAAAAVPTDTSTDPNANAYGAGYSDFSGTDPYSAYSGNYGGATTSGYYDQATGAWINSGTSGQTVTMPSTNSAWSQQALAYLTAQGYDPLTVSAALGAAFAGIGLTADQYNVVEAAITLEGQPPNGFSVPPHVNPPAGQTSGSGGTTTTTTVKPPSLSVMTGINTKNHTAAIKWTDVPGAVHYHVRRNGNGYKDTTGHSLTVPVPGSYQVEAVNASGQSSVPSNTVKF